MFLPIPSLPMTWKPLTFFAVALAGRMNRHQQDAVAYLTEENHILREKLGKKRLILNESQKCRLATAAMKLGKDLLRQFGTLFSPDTLLRWHRWFVARKYDGLEVTELPQPPSRAPSECACGDRGRRYHLEASTRDDGGLAYTSN